MVIYANLFQKKKIASSSFLYRFSFCLFCVIGLGEGFKILKFINYANLCKFTEPWKGPGGAIGFSFFFFLFYYFFFLFFFHVPSGASNLYFSHSNFFIFSPFPGHQIFIFWPVENCTTWNLWYLMLRDAGWALRHWRSCLRFWSKWSESEVCFCWFNLLMIWYSVFQVITVPSYSLTLLLYYNLLKGPMQCKCMLTCVDL